MLLPSDHHYEFLRALSCFIFISRLQWLLRAMNQLTKGEELSMMNMISISKLAEIYVDVYVGGKSLVQIRPKFQ